MLTQSQKNPKWSNVKIGHSNTTIGEAGCFVVSISNMIDKTPIEVNDILTAANAYKGDLIIWSKAAPALGMRWDSTTGAPVFSPCILVTDHYKPQGVPQHAVVLLGGGATIVDPLDGRQKPSSVYRVSSYRNISPPLPNSQGDKMTHDQIIETIRISRESLFGHIDHPAAEADTVRVEAEFAAGNKYALGEQIRRYVESDEFKNKYNSHPELAEKIDQLKADVGILNDKIAKIREIV